MANAKLAPALATGLPSVPSPQWHVYMVRCADGTLYTGIATDVKRRVAEHNDEGGRLGARYTRARRPVALVYQEPAANRSEAGKREYQLKQLPRSEKLALIASGRRRKRLATPIK